jgi:hypothetical protein
MRAESHRSTRQVYSLTLFLLSLSVSIAAQETTADGPKHKPAKYDSQQEPLGVPGTTSSGPDLNDTFLPGSSDGANPALEIAGKQGIDWRIVEIPSDFEGRCLTSQEINSVGYCSSASAFSSFPNLRSAGPDLKYVAWPMKDVVCSDSSADKDPACRDRTGPTAIGVLTDRKAIPCKRVTVTSLSFPISHRPDKRTQPANGDNSAEKMSHYSSSVPPAISSVALAENSPEGFHWKSALQQSFYFLIFEHAFRMADDPYARYLVWHKPFWHDYFSSFNDFDMGRWGDGDDFLVNYIGHPMQGAVSGYIQIQNDPKSRVLKFSKSSSYWKSRLKAMAWAAAYSTYFEVGPVLSETALGSEGGYTYTPGCRSPCDHPAGHKPPTNNTGWVDFIVTPTIGTGWIVLEDSMETEIVDRVSHGDNALKFELLRSVLNPSHSLANFFQGREPWYRSKASVGSESALTNSRSARANHPPKEPLFGRTQLGMQYSTLNLPMDREGCPSCRVTSSGVGMSFGYRILPWLAFDSQGNFFPGGGGFGEKGNATEGLFGAKLGRPFNSWGIFATMRPGVIHYDKVLSAAAPNQYGSVNRFAFDVGATFEYYVSKRGAVRFEIGNTLVRYLTDQVDPRQPLISVLSPDYIVTHSNFHFGTGYLVRF